MKNVNEDQLVEAIRRQPETGWTEAYKTYGKAMKGAAYKVVHNVDDADDAVMQAMTSVMAKGLLANVTNLKSYLCGAATHKARDHVRKVGREVLQEDVTDIADREIDRHPGDGVEESALAHLTVDELRARMDTVLNEKQRYALEQRVMRRRPAKEVAAELDVKGPRVAQLVREALEVLRGTSTSESSISRDISLSGAPGTDPEGDR